MRILVTGSAGHLGEALVRTLRKASHEVVGLDCQESPWTTHVGSIADAEFVHRCVRGVDCVMHAATLHKPHVATHSRADFVATNISGTLNVLEAALAHGIDGVVFTSTTSVFGGANRPGPDEPAAWITEDVTPIPKNIYGVTKRAAEDLCELFYRSRGLPSIVLRTSRFFIEEDDNSEQRSQFADLNLKVNEFLHRRLDIEDAVEAHLLAARQLADIGFARYVVSATTPFDASQLERLRTDAAGVVGEIYPDQAGIYRQLGWTMYPGIERVYVNRRIRQELGWRPRFDFRHALDRAKEGGSPFSRLAHAVGSKGYHAQTFETDGPYPVEEAC